MASLGRRLKKYATLSYLHELITDPAKVGTATRDGAGLMSPDQVRKLERIEDNATGDMKGDEIVAALQKLSESVKSLDIDVLKVGGKEAGDFAQREHKHDDLYYPREQVRDLIKTLDEGISMVAAAQVRLYERVDALERDVSARLLSDSYNGDTINQLLLMLEQTDINAARVGGASLEDLDHRFARADAVAQSRPAAQSGGVVKGGSYSPDPSKGDLARYTNGGDHTFAAPAVKFDYEMKVAITHGKGAGRITFNGFPVNPSSIFGAHHVGENTLIVITKIGSFLDIEVR